MRNEGSLDPMLFPTPRVSVSPLATPRLQRTWHAFQGNPLILQVRKLRCKYLQLVYHLRSVRQEATSERNFSVSFHI